MIHWLISPHVASIILSDPLMTMNPFVSLPIRWNVKITLYHGDDAKKIVAFFDLCFSVSLSRSYRVWVLMCSGSGYFCLSGSLLMCACTAGICVCLCADRQTEVSDHRDGKQQQAFDDAQYRRHFFYSASHPDGLPTTDQPNEQWGMRKCAQRLTCTHTETDKHTHTHKQITMLLLSWGLLHYVSIFLQSFYLVCMPHKGVNLTVRGSELCILKWTRAAGILEPRDERETRS